MVPAFKLRSRSVPVNSLGLGWGEEEGVSFRALFTMFCVIVASLCRDRRHSLCEYSTSCGLELSLAGICLGAVNSVSDSLVPVSVESTPQSVSAV